MIKIRATVISWQQGRALLQTESSLACESCSVDNEHRHHTTCILNACTGKQHEMLIAQPLKPGQQIWLHIPGSSLLYAGFIVYLIPLSGLILGGTGFHGLFFNDYLTAAGAFTGGISGFLMARCLSRKYEKQMCCQGKVSQTISSFRMIDIQIKSPRT